MNVKAILVILTIGLTLIGCATEYGKKGFIAGGYDETQLAPDMFSVTFSGNDSTEMQRVVDFALLRSAEIALEQGYPYFEVVGSRQWTETNTLSTPGVSSSAGTYAGSGNTGAGSYASSSVGGTTMTENEPRASNVIRLLKAKGDARELAYEAQFLAKALREKYNITPE